MSETTIAQLEIRREELKAFADTAEAHDRLCRNKDFKKIILDGFMVSDCSRYVQESGDPLLSAENRADALALAQAAGHLKRYLQIQRTMALRAASDIQAIDEAIQEMRDEREGE